MNDKTLRDNIEETAKLLRHKITDLNQKGDLDILSLLDIVDKRVEKEKVELFIEKGSDDTEQHNYLKTLLKEEGRFSQDLSEYIATPSFIDCFNAILGEKVIIEKFKTVKKDWMRFRKFFMLSVRLKDMDCHRKFIFLECLFRMLLIWHERIEVMNAKKNLRMINHLIVKYELNSKFKENPKFITIMNFLGDKFEDNKLRKRLKQEGSESAVDHVLKKLKRGSEEQQGKKEKNSIFNGEGDGFGDMSFLSQNTNSSFSFTQEGKNQAQIPVVPLKGQHSEGRMMEQVQNTTLSRGKQTLNGDSSSFKNKKLIEIEDDVRELTFEKIKSQLLEVVPEKRALSIAKNLESQLFAKFYQNDSEYDKHYSLLIFALQKAMKDSSLMINLFDEYFDFDLLLSIALRVEDDKFDIQLGKRSSDKTTQTQTGRMNSILPSVSGETTLLDMPLNPNNNKSAQIFNQRNNKASNDNNMSEIVDNLRDSETLYLQKLVNRLRKENGYLKNLIFELRLDLTNTSTPK